MKFIVRDKSNIYTGYRLAYDYTGLLVDNNTST